MNDLALTPNHQQVTAALSLLDDYTSLTVRKGAAQYLTGSLSNQDSELIEPAIQRIWTCASQESNPLVVAEYLKTLGTLKERAANSIPLIAHYLGHQDEDIALAATKALCDLSDTVPTAWIPLLAACPENIQAEIIRDAKFLALKESDPAKYNIYESELSWIKGRPKAQQSAWLSGLDTKKTLGDFSESERCRFLLLYSDPRGENLWGCMKFLHISQKGSSTNKVSDDIWRAISACEGCFLRDINSIDIPVKARYIARVLSQATPFTASLAVPLSRLSLDISLSPVADMEVQEAAARLAPSAPPPEALRRITHQLLCQDDSAVRNFAIDCLVGLMPLLQGDDARLVIDDVFDFLTDPVVRKKSVITNVANIITEVRPEEIPTIFRQLGLLLKSEAPLISKVAAIATLGGLRYEKDPLESLSPQAKDYLSALSNSPNPRIAGAARAASKKLEVRERVSPERQP
jgi:hypothetical protein